MTRHAVQYFTVPTMASGATSSSAIDIGSEGYDRISLVIPTMTSGTDIYVQGSYDNSTFLRLCHAVSSGVATAAAISIASGLSQIIVPLPNVNSRYLKVEHSTACSDSTYSYKVIIN